MASSGSKASESQPDLEKQPLLSDKTQEQKTFGTVEKSGTKQAPGGEDHNDEWDSTQYDMSKLTTWTAFTMMQGAAFDNPTTWRCMTFALILSCCVAGGTFVTADSQFINPGRIQKLATFLNVFVGLLLGFFLSSSMNRWYGCVNAFMRMLDAVRSMQMQMTALGVDRERTEMLSRYGVLSAWLLHLSLNSSSHKAGSDDKHLSETEQRENAWKWLEETRPHLVIPKEKEVLLQQSESYASLWTWVASLIGRMSQNGEIPPMASPTYGRIIEIIDMAYGSIRDVKTLHLVKAPFIYVHTLACLVHVNHILNAIGFGLLLGMTSQAMVERENRSLSRLPELVSSLFLQLCMSMVAPFLYLALLDVSICVSQPFTYQDTKIPALQFIRTLEQDIVNAATMADNTKWEKPRFKK